ncbi:hypothetical protein V6N13_082555 [Hibiscus sabdariffa]|uniref:Uncharacterized protein n=1 Tax=Hibiscus sabdariffa TaxID=183260 RepID=A0ABR2Q3S5_9ROSI
MMDGPLISKCPFAWKQPAISIVVFFSYTKTKNNIYTKPSSDLPLLFSDDCLDDPSLHEHDDSALKSNPFFVIPPLLLNLLLSSSRVNLFLPPSSGF